jgi:hypothetical protein
LSEWGVVTMVDHYPPVKQFETIRFEAEQQAQLLDELRELRGRRTTRLRRSWRQDMSTFEARHLGGTRRERQGESATQACACSNRAR